MADTIGSGPANVKLSADRLPSHPHPPSALAPQRHFYGGTRRLPEGSTVAVLRRARRLERGVGLARSTRDCLRGQLSSQLVDQKEVTGTH
jgi:hypothetical protein